MRIGQKLLRALPVGKPIISVYYSPTKRVAITGACVRIPQLDRSLKSAYGESLSVVMVGKLEEVFGFTFTKADAAGLVKRIKPRVKDLYVEEDSDTARCVRLDIFLDWEEQQQAGHICGQTSFTGADECGPCAWSFSPWHI